jgi:hypothetical protein
MKLHFTREWLKNKIETDPDLPCEVGAMNGEFAKPRQRDTDLHDRVQLYYELTKNLDNRAAVFHSKELHEWWKSRGYTQEEYNAAKRNCEHAVR